MKKTTIILLATAVTGFADFTGPFDKQLDARRAIAVATPLPPSKESDIKSHETTGADAAKGGALFTLFASSLFCAYFLPSIVSARRKHHNANAICLLNLFLG